MSSIRCLNCGAPLAMITDKGCPACGAPIPPIRKTFLLYLGAEDDLKNFKTSYKLVFLKCLFEQIQISGYASILAVTESFRRFYLNRKQNGFPVEQDADARIRDIEQHDLSDIWLFISMNPYAVLSRKDFVRVSGNALSDQFILPDGLNDFSQVELNNLQSLLSLKLRCFYKTISNHSEKQIEVQTWKPVKKQIKHVSSESAHKNAKSNAKQQSGIEQPKESAKPIDDPEIAAVRQTPLEEVPLSTQTYNWLKKNNIDTVEQLEEVCDNGQIAEFPRARRFFLDEIAKRLDLGSDLADFCAEQTLIHKKAVKLGKFSRDLSDGIKQKRISEIYHEDKFEKFVDYCTQNGFVSASDLIGIAFEYFLKVPGIRFPIIEEISKRWLALTESSKLEVTEAELHTVKIHPSNKAFSIQILRYNGGFRKITNVLSSLGIDKLEQLDGLDTASLRPKLKDGEIDDLRATAELFESPYSHVLKILLENISKDSNFELLKKRAMGDTLQKVAVNYKLTRERVRQICNSLSESINLDIVPMTAQLMEENHERFFRQSQITEAVQSPDFRVVVEYALCNNPDFISVGSPKIFLEKAAFPNAEKDLMDAAVEIVGDGINVFESENAIESQLEAKGFGFLTADDFLGILISSGFIFYGEYAVQSTKSYGLLCAKIVEEEFPNGIANRKEDLDRLRQLTIEKFGNLDLPESDRSFFSRVSTHLVLRDRATYIAPKHVYVDDSLLDEIKTYIDESEIQDLYYRELFAQFEGVLMMMTNIDNASFLHGVLAYKFPDEYTYTRDYLHKNNGLTARNLGDRIAGYIAEKGKACTREELLEQFPGISNVMLFNAVTHTPDLMQWEDNVYNCGGNLNLTERDVRILQDEIEAIQKHNDGYCSAGMLFQAVSKRNAEILSKSKAETSQNLFYAAQSVLNDRFEFKAPHIARQGRFTVLNTTDIALELLKNPNQISAERFLAMADKFMWPRITAGITLTDFEQKYLRISQDLYVRKTKVKLTEADVVFLKSYLNDQASGNWFLPLTKFTKSEDVIPSGYGINEFFVGTVADIYDLGWHIVRPKMKDRRYQRGILVRNDRHIFAYDQLIAEFLKQKGIHEINEEDLLTLLQVYGLVYAYLPRELKTSGALSFQQQEGMFEL